MINSQLVELLQHDHHHANVVPAKIKLPPPPPPSAIPSSNRLPIMSSVVSLAFTSIAFGLVLLVMYQVKAEYHTRVARLRAEFQTQLNLAQTEIKEQMDGLNYGSMAKETEALRADIAALRRGVNRSFDQRAEIEKAAMGISQLWSEVYRLRNEAASAIIDYSTGTSSTANNSSSGSQQSARRLVPSTRINMQPSESFRPTFKSLTSIQL